MVWAVFMLPTYLEGVRLTIITNQDVLWWILNMAGETGKLARLRLRLSELEFDVGHQTGIKQKADNALSRLETRVPYTS